MSDKQEDKKRKRHYRSIDSFIAVNSKDPNPKSCVLVNSVQERVIHNKEIFVEFSKEICDLLSSYNLDDDPEITKAINHITIAQDCLTRVITNQGATVESKPIKDFVYYGRD